jgi:hypothetical protein
MESASAGNDPVPYRQVRTDFDGSTIVVYQVTRSQTQNKGVPNDDREVGVCVLSSMGEDVVVRAVQNDAPATCRWLPG